jgi:glutamate formiminotransferase
MEKETKAIKEELYKFCWYMRGGLSFTEAIELNLEDREILGKIVSENLETTKKSNLPFF